MNPVFYELTGVGVTLLVATASYYLIEKPFLKLRLRYNSSKTESTLLTTQSRTAEST
jgi:peptidoglycan/LPS O-acetylase OafA/YrhL